MRIHLIITAAAAAAALTAGFAAVAQTNYEPERTAIVPMERVQVQPANHPAGPYHGGYITDRDELLLSDAIGALASARDMNGVIVTMVANNGELVVNGTATVAQGSRIESMFKRLAGVTHVTAWFDSSGA
jgi:poly(3-hydroxybutyrate) depolymerase